jgi:dinuclear metal center YbgI/SA1388 family protein
MTPIQDVLEVLEGLAPLHLAAPWDNVGWLIEGTRGVSRVACTIDCTPAVVEEVLANDIDLLISYHPPIFGGLKRLVGDDPMARSLLDLIRAGVHVYSPHTALDAVQGGVNDWLLEAMGPLASSQPLQPHQHDAQTGQGRRATLASPKPASEVLAGIRSHLGLEAVWWMSPSSEKTLIESVAVCPGAGGSLLAELEGMDLVLTGELRHHDQLALSGRGTWVVMTGHTSTERGYLPRWINALQEALPSVHFEQASADQELLQWG